ncbi:MAG: formylglycine-generating enzyme family protein [Phycisphaerales bacterium]|nr:formylglycine-generating enzyme family protein [Phycisphaerales bacterium]
MQPRPAPLLSPASRFPIVPIGRFRGRNPSRRSRLAWPAVACALLAFAAQAPCHGRGQPERGAPPTVEPQPGERLTLELSPGVEVELAWIPLGAFEMGSPVDEAGRESDESPRHAVRIGRGFWMMTTEVRQDQLIALMQSNPSRFKDDARQPVQTVGWFEAVEFANRLTEAVAARHPRLGLRPHYRLEGVERFHDGQMRTASVHRVPEHRGFRLPTEAEWEYACRAGTTGPFHTGETILSEQANFKASLEYRVGDAGLYRERTEPAGSLAPNAWGLHDMHGNVWEWCWDWYDDRWYEPDNCPVNEHGERTDPQGPANGSERVLRGGSWYDGPWFLRSAHRNRLGPAFRYYNNGFRLVLDPD